jgi:hypothetical protein
MRELPVDMLVSLDGFASGGEGGACTSAVQTGGVLAAAFSL